MDTNPSNIIWICFSANAWCSAHEVLFMQAEACIPRFATLLCLLLCAQWMSTFGICGFPANTIRCSSGQVRSEYVRPYWNACVLVVSPNYSKCLSWVKGRWFWILQNATRSPREFEFSRLPFLWNSSAQTAAFLLFLDLLLAMMMMMRHRQMRTVGGLRAGCGKWARQDCGLMIKPAAEAHPVKWQEDNETGQGLETDRVKYLLCIDQRPCTELSPNIMAARKTIMEAGNYPHFEIWHDLFACLVTMPQGRFRIDRLIIIAGTGTPCGFFLAFYKYAPNSHFIRNERTTLSNRSIFIAS